MHYIVFGVGVVLSVLALMIYSKKKKNKELVDVVLISLLVTVILELLTFNYASFCYYGDSYANKQYEQSKNQLIVSNVGNKCTVKINNIDTKVRDFYIDYQVAPDQASTIEVSFGDEALPATFVTGKNQVVVPAEEITKYIKINPSGKVSNLDITLSKLKKSYGGDVNADNCTYSNIKVVLNKRIPLNISLFRMVAVFILLFVIQFVYKYRYVKWDDIKPGFRKLIYLSVVFGWTLMMWLLSITYINNVDQKEILQDVNYDTADQYHLLTLAMAKGQFNIDGLYKEKDKQNFEKEQLDKLKALDDPYNSNSVRKNIKYKWDVAYYNGHYYTYYGPVPVVLVFLPVYLLTGSMLGTRFFTLIVAAIIAWLMCRLVVGIAERRKNLNVWTVVGTMLSFLLVTQIPSCFRQAKFYELSPMMSIMFALAGINVFYSIYKNKKISYSYLALGSTLMALAVGCKATGILYSLVIIPFLIKLLYNNGRFNYSDKNKVLNFLVKIFNKNNIKAIVAIMVPYIVIGTMIMIYNAVRFDSPFDFGVNYQLTVYNVKYFSIKSIGKLPSVIISGLLQLPRFSAEFPFVHPSLEHTQYMGYLFTYLGWVGIITYPVMWTLALLPWSMKRGIKTMQEKSFVIASLCVGGFLTYMIIAVGGISLRYPIEYLFLLFIPVIYIIMDLEEACRKHELTKYFVMALLGVVLIALFINCGLYLSEEWNTAFSEKPELFYKLWKSFTFWR